MFRPKMISHYQPYLQEYRQRIFYSCNCVRHITLLHFNVPYISGILHLLDCTYIFVCRS
jgi:hypothetical protein